MKNTYIHILLLLLGLSHFVVAAPTYYEAESGVLTGVYTTTAVGGYSGSSYVTGFDNATDKVVITVNAPSAGIYQLYIRYVSPFGNKTQDVYINNVFSTSVVFTGTGTFAEIMAGTVSLNAGNNTIGIHNNWGYMDVDRIGIELKPPNVYNITPNLINPNATTKTKALYNLLRGQFGNCILSGQTNYWNELIAISGKTPAVRGFDMQNYSPMNPWGWAGCCPAWGGWDDGTVDAAINWYNATGGIVTFHWHWFSPFGGSLQTSTFYTTQTSFDVSRISNTSNQEYIDVIRDIDAIAVQLKKLQTAGVPVLWRPLHEAGGAWFWWGAKGSASCLLLYDIMYNRLTNYHGLNNLIWVWSTPEPSWYPGNSKVDIIGYDSYPGAYNYTTQKSYFDQLYTIVGGQKLIALTENGPIPDIAQCFAQDAPWSYFMSWVDMVATQNTNAHIVNSYNQTCNLDDLASLPVNWLAFTGENTQDGIVLKWKTASEINNLKFVIERSQDGITFNYLSELKGGLTTQENKFYSYTDTKPHEGISYYRIKQVDISGNHSYSSTISIESNSDNNLIIHPNPNNGTFFISSTSPIESITIYNPNGNVIYNENNNFIKQNYLKFYQPNLSQGIYLVIIKSNQQQILKKIVIE